MTEDGDARRFANKVEGERKRNEVETLPSVNNMREMLTPSNALVDSTESVVDVT